MAYQSTIPGRFVFVFLALAVGCSQLPLDSGDVVPIDPMDAGSEGGASITPTGGVAAGGQGGQGAVTLVGGNLQGGTGTGGAVTGGAGTGGTAMGGMVTGGNAAGGAGTGGTAMGGMGTGGTAMGGMGTGGTAMGGAGGGGCTPGTYRCNGTTSESCANGTFIFSQECGPVLGCNVTTGKCNVCMASASSCSMNKRSVCSADGQTLTQETCAYGCITGGVDCRECATDGDIECPSATSVRTCTMGRATPPSMCPGVQICSAGKGCGCPTGTGLLDGECLDLEGYYEPFNYSTSIGGGFLSAQKFTVTRGGIVRALGLVGQRPSSRVRMGLYRDSSGNPGTLLVESVVGDVASGLTFYKTTSWPTITAGTYWLGALYETTGQVLRDLDNPIPTRSLAYAFTKSLPANLNGATASTASPVNYFVVIE